MTQSLERLKKQIWGRTSTTTAKLYQRTKPQRELLPVLTLGDLLLQCQTATYSCQIQKHVITAKIMESQLLLLSQSQLYLPPSIGAKWVASSLLLDPHRASDQTLECLLMLSQGKTPQCPCLPTKEDGETIYIASRTLVCKESEKYSIEHFSLCIPKSKLEGSWNVR